MDCLDLASQYDNKDCVELLLDFMTESETPEDDCCKYSIVPCEYCNGYNTSVCVCVIITL